MRISKFLLSSIVFLLCSCGQSKDTSVVTHSGTRNKVSSVNLTSIVDQLPMIHSGARLTACGDTLIIHDSKSTDKQFIAYDLDNGKYLGSFGIYGEGPGEIFNFGGLCYDAKRGIMYGLSLSKWQIDGFKLSEAIADSTYKAFVKVKMTDHQGRPFNTPYYVNDTTIICSVFVPDQTGMKLTSKVGNFNLTTGVTELLDTIDDGIRNSALTTVVPSKGIIIETGINHDRIRFYDLNGNLGKTILGPDYSEKYDGRAQYFSEPVIAGDKILAIYSGMDFIKNGIGHEIIVMDLDGNYIRTLDLGARISSIIYHDKTDRVYVSMDNEPQFGYFNLSEALGQADSVRTEAGSAAREAPIDETPDDESDKEVQQSETEKNSDQDRAAMLDNGIKVIYSSPLAANAPKYKETQKSSGPLDLLDPLAHNFVPVEIATIGARPAGEKKILYDVTLYNSGLDTATIESIMLPDARFEVEWPGLVEYIPHLLSTFKLISNEAVELDDYHFIITYKGDKYPPQTFHINLHPDIYRLMEERK